MQPGDANQRIKARAEEVRATRTRRRAEMLVLMRGISRRFKNLVSKIGRAELNASFIEYEIFQLLKMMEECAREADEIQGVEGSIIETHPSANEPLRHLAESGASSLEIRTRPDGTATVRIDGGKQFTLPPTLADLITALSIDNGPGDDAFVGWKSVKEVADYLTKQSGKPVTKRAITQNLYRLRKELFDRGGVNPYLVQSNRRRGIRFALRRIKSRDWS
ncbi:MAG TPA: hypothetical protein VLM38_04925 [Blastocatellia bacterium]|nr:hypothetical protein [Blastocatellia bacterium]